MSWGSELESRLLKTQLIYIYCVSAQSIFISANNLDQSNTDPRHHRRTVSVPRVDSFLIYWPFHSPPYLTVVKYNSPALTPQRGTELLLNGNKTSLATKPSSVWRLRMQWADTFGGSGDGPSSRVAPRWRAICWPSPWPWFPCWRFLSLLPSAPAPRGKKARFLSPQIPSYEKGGSRSRLETHKERHAWFT